MFERLHHRRISRVLEALDGPRLRRFGCLFGGGTAIALLHDEFRESVDMDFLVSDPEGYRQLRALLAGARDLGDLLRDDADPVALARDIRIDQYGMRTVLQVEDTPIKFEIIREARIDLEQPGRRDTVLGIATLTPADLAASKLLANSDRWRDDSAFSRDVIDLAMMAVPLRTFHLALNKARAAYGEAVVDDLLRALDGLNARPGRLQRCMSALAMTLPPAFVQQRLRILRRRLLRATATS